MDNNKQKQASDFDNFTYQIAPSFEDGFYGFAVDKDFYMSILQAYLDCETEEEEKKIDRALRKIKNFHTSMDRAHLKNKAKYEKEMIMFKESNFGDFVNRQEQKYGKKEINNNNEDPRLIQNRNDAKQVAEEVEKGKVVSQVTSPELPTRSTIQLAQQVEKLEDDRTYEQKQAGMLDFKDPSDPDFTKAKWLHQKATEQLGEHELAVFREAYNKPETYQRLCNLWDYFYKNRPDSWPPRPILE